MDINLLKTLGQTAGIGGIALGIFLISFREIIRKNIFPNLTKKQAYRLLIVSILSLWSIGVIGILSWIYTKDRVNSNTKIVQDSKGDNSPNVSNIKGDVKIIYPSQKSETTFYENSSKSPKEHDK